MHSFRINVFGAPVIYTGSSTSAIPIPIAPASPPYQPPRIRAASTQNAFPTWKDVAPPPGSGIFICKKVNVTKHSAAISAVWASFVTVSFLFSIGATSFLSFFVTGILALNWIY